MRQSKFSKSFIYTVVIFFITFMLCLSFFPLAYTVSGKLNFNVDISDVLVNRQSSFNHIEYKFIFANLPENEFFTNIEIIQILDSGIWNSRRFLPDILNGLLLPITSIALFAYAYSSAYRKFNKRIPVIAIFIGGHAPPITQT